MTYPERVPLHCWAHRSYLEKGSQIQLGIHSKWSLGFHILVPRKWERRTHKASVPPDVNTAVASAVPISFLALLPSTSQVGKVKGKQEDGSPHGHIRGIYHLPGFLYFQSWVRSENLYLRVRNNMDQTDSSPWMKDKKSIATEVLVYQAFIN